MKKLPIGIQTFSEIIEDDYAYVDKTSGTKTTFPSAGSGYILCLAV